MQLNQQNITNLDFLCWYFSNRQDAERQRQEWVDMCENWTSVTSNKRMANDRIKPLHLVKIMPINNIENSLNNIVYWLAQNFKHQK